MIVLLELLEGGQHVGSRNRLRLSSVLHPSLDELLNQLLSGVHSAVKHEGQEVANQQTLAKGDPEHLVFAQAKALSDPLDVGLVPTRDWVDILGLR